ncbi:hypothetical protein [Paenibacillus sp. MSJ-34]|uniref:hypothetical protein n=1 Tax=Paenibacillus sp. MSJ-34 TaxID=2841529 RepID=UPI001C1199B0|nr:hypothetical protein [Paenibacillus sp. MSJ-34]MBU5444195.1 hypothetical protein [Paenibacillus sp. MSJ-34]
MNQTNDILDVQVSMGRLIWIMDDETYNQLFILTKRHLNLVKEHLDINTAYERKAQIKDEIEAIRQQRDLIIQQYQN